MLILPVKASESKSNTKKLKKVLSGDVFSLQDIPNDINIEGTNEIKAPSNISNIFNLNLINFANDVSSNNYYKCRKLLTDLELLLDSILINDKGSKELMLTSVQYELKSKREESLNPELEDILKTIELRAAVELAKINKISK